MNTNGVDVILVIKHADLTIFKRYKDALDVLLPSYLKLGDICDLMRHLLDEILPTLVVKGVKILVHSRDDNRFV